MVSGLPIKSSKLSAPGQVHPEHPGTKDQLRRGAVVFDRFCAIGHC
jgi:hypothetical protein